MYLYVVAMCCSAKLSKLETGINLIEFLLDIIFESLLSQTGYGEYFAPLALKNDGLRDITKHNVRKNIPERK